MGARRYGISPRVLNLISHDKAQWTSEISSWTREEKFHIADSYLLFLCFWTAFQIISEHFRKVFQILSKSFPKSRQSFSAFPNISEGCHAEISEITKDFLGKSDDVSMTQERILVLIKRLFNHRTGDHITYKKKNMLFSRVKYYNIFWCDDIKFTSEGSLGISLGLIQ